MTLAIETFHYRLAHPGYCAIPGAHPGQMVGSGQLFKRHESLLASPDPRRLDLRASLLDPFNHYRVKVFQQHSKIDVLVIADLSASMSIPGGATKLQIAADFLLSCAQSAFESGDNFGFIGCGHGIEKKWLFPKGLRMGRVQELARDLSRVRSGQGGNGLFQVEPYLPLRRSLVFLLSDFHFDLNRLSRLAGLFGRHAVVPLVLWDPAEYADLPEWGIVKFQDSENRRTRTLLMRPGLKRKIIEAYEQRRDRLRHGLRSKGAEPVFIEGRYEASALTNYFLQRVV
ncbi:DUF58 domain-containing protein [Methylotuvimicrobium alcaliphilum]|uniref:MxaS protein involved in methanol oxidation n=1 Tax=Methylotuvimicrobium alcaliphilum (strain DSM 19304 / NCIMB 14124 / VKM B-2133 / 20Z) TaxID=1091494 RepID=G4SV07_META2|nr:MxaS protein [Methylotuvimicrobium alcaliphilum]CCE25105.1 putative MxaS protein involved in methanol oxidation [Methylotuvimicrobium alcaliphilum 20Z]